MERKAYNKDVIERVMKLDINIEHPDWPKWKIDEEMRKKSRIDKTVFELTILDLKNRLFKEANGWWTQAKCKEDAKYIMDNIPQELITNINEWLDDKCLSDIKVRGLSILDVMNQYGETRTIDFISAVKCLIAWKNTEYEDANFCLHYFAKM